MLEEYCVDDLAALRPLYRQVREYTQMFLGYAKDISKLYRYALVG